jgi:1-acyl-sn-glycerol-3-phosphate acyltransferase
MKIGFVEANRENAMKQLGKNNLIVVFPEGEFGNFKPSVKRYHLQPFKRGFIRMALATQSPIVPTLVIGAEETHLNLTQLKLPKRLRSLVLPLPLNLIPLPVKWKIVFLKPIYLPYKPEAADDEELVRELADEVREEMQKAISHEVATRGSLFR